LKNGLDKKIIKVLPLNQLFSYQSLSPLKKKPRKFKTFSSEFFYGPSFFHEEIKKQKTRKNLHVIKKKTKIYICPALSSQVLKNPKPRFTRK